MATPPLPPPDASPATVRSWFTTLLHELHSVPENEAREIASKWQFGRGSELRYYDVSTFRDIFGVEVGTLLYGHARGEVRSVVRGPSAGVETMGRERPTKDVFGLTPGLGLVYVMLGLSIVFGAGAWVEKDPERAGTMTILAILSASFFGGLYCLFYVG